MSSGSFKGKVVVVTGATAGVGRATVRALAKEGAHVVLLARDKERLEITKKEVETLGGKALAISVDVADYTKLATVGEQIEIEFGHIDIWINNAMTTVLSPVIEITPEEFMRVTEVTYLGCVYGTMVALKYMFPRNQGIIIQVGSALAYRGLPLQAAYSGAKHAVQGFTESLRSELMHANSQVKVTMVQLPALNTPQFTWMKNRLLRRAQPVPPIYQPEVAADAILWAARHYQREWYVGFPTVLAILGNRVAPGLGDRYLAKNGFDAQQYDGSEDLDRPNNLFEPVSGDFGAHGEFDSKAHKHSWLFQMSKHKSEILILVALVLLVFLLIPIIL